MWQKSSSLEKSRFRKKQLFWIPRLILQKHPLRLIGDPLLILLILIFTFPAQSQIYSLQLQGLFTPQLFIPKKVDMSVPFFQNQCPLFGKIIDASFRSFFNPILELNDITSSSFLEFERYALPIKGLTDGRTDHQTDRPS